MVSGVSYIALARKWRPKNFSELVGQTHVMQALANALDQNRLHHAYLFTGTRGVGKTTIARIFAKALNCEQGVSSHPCGECSTCRSIDEGRFVDLIEVDAASRTKVEDTREILDNVQYAPTQGRYKVYLIDEVHMLSKSSFNALLKTLEEPPEHVKFLLATTDPHKLPVTVLSRCLQFNLMRLTVPQIQQHLANVLQQEQIPFEAPALTMIAKSADGSIRDSLSLLDQAIAYGGGTVKHEAVQAMLGLVSQETLHQILQVFVARDAQQVSDLMADLSLRGVNYEQLLAELIEALYEISRIQVLGHSPSENSSQSLQSFAQQLPPQNVQMLYQMALLARQDLKWAPDARIGFEMAMLRMVAFELPEYSTNPKQQNISTENAKIPSPAVKMTKTPKQPKAEDSHSGVAVEADVADLPGMAAMQQLQAMKAKQKEKEEAAEPRSSSQNRAPQQTEPEDARREEIAQPVGKSFDAVEKARVASPEAASFSAPMANNVDALCQTLSPQPVEQWLSLIERAQLEGMAAELARQSLLLKLDLEQKQLFLSVQQSEAKTELAQARLEEGLNAYLMQTYGEAFQIIFCEAKTGDVGLTPAQWQAQQQQNKQEAAKQAFLQDPFVQQFQQLFAAKVIESSIQAK